MTTFIESKAVTLSCPVCESDSIVRHGQQRGEQRYRCRTCDATFRSNNTMPRRRLSNDRLGSVLDMYYDGMSYKRVAETLAAAHQIPEPSKNSVYDWVQSYSQRAADEFDKYKPKSGGMWVADEMVVDVGGDKFWLWNVMDAKSRFVLATHLSKERNGREASIVMRKAKDKAATLPKWIKTDKLPSYGVAINRVFGGDAMVGHMRSEGIAGTVNNNMSERLQGTFRARTKVMRGLQSQKSGQRFLDGWVIDYNFFRPHMALNGKTPAAAAGLDVPISSWAEVAALPKKREGRKREFREHVVTQGKLDGAFKKRRNA